MDVSGTDIKTVRYLNFQKLTKNIGPQRLKKTY